MIGVVVSRADEASVRVGEQLRELEHWTRETDETGECWRTDGFELRAFDDWHLDLDGVADAFSDPSFVVFASRHSGETGPLLTAHFTGNFGRAEYGGDDRSLAAACPNAHRRVFAAFDEYAPEGYDVGMECTHHGPSDVGAPSMFVELGSGESEWRDPAGAEAVARSILALRGVDPHSGRALVGFGGGHYVPRQTRIVRETDWAFGHVGADWSLDELGDPDAHADVVERAFAASNAEHAVLDGDHPRLEATIEDLGYRVVSETWVREVDGVPLALVDALERDLGPVDNGLRFGTPAESADPDADYEDVDLPDDLWTDARGVDPDRALAAARETALAYGTAENGNRVEGRAAFPDRTAYDAYVARLADLLRGKYDSVTVTGDAVVVEDTAFDPELARERGVPEGPKFGRLANGRAVEVDGETVEPAAVASEHTRRYPL